MTRGRRCGAGWSDLTSDYRSGVVIGEPSVEVPARVLLSS
jgi:hypothetical protein